jgi:hypothetical protein
MTTGRIDPPLRGWERETLRAYLDFHRATLAQKWDGLPDEDLRRRSVPPSALSLLGLVRHRRPAAGGDRRRDRGLAAMPFS